MRFFRYIFVIAAAAAMLSCGGAPSDSDFLEIVKTDALEEVKEGIDKKANLDARTKRDKMTPLMVAARYNTSDVVKALVDAGADVNAQDSVENTALRYAITYNTAETVAILVDGGADANVVGKLGVTPSIVVSMRGTPEMGRILINAAADPYVADMNPVEQYRRGPMYFAEFNEKIPTRDRIELFAKPLDGTVEALVTNIADVAAKRPTEGSVLEGNVVLTRRQQPMTGKTETRLYVQSVEAFTDGYVGLMTVDASGTGVPIQVYPIPAELGSQLKQGDGVSLSGMFFWGKYDDIEDEEYRRASRQSSTKFSFLLRERFIMRSGNDPLFYVTEISRSE